MADIIPFPTRPEPMDEPPAVDVFTALDVAIRDLRELAAATSGETRYRIEACRDLLERAYLPWP